MISQSEIVRVLRAACVTPEGKPRSKDDPIYAAITEHRDVGAMRARYSSCGDLGNWLLAAAGVPGANHGHNYRVGRNISALAWHPLSRAANSGWYPAAVDIMILWNLASTSDAHCAILLEGAAPPHELDTANYGAGGMSAAASPGACVARKWLRQAPNGVWFYGSKYVRRVITWTAWSTAATQTPELPQ